MVPAYGIKEFCSFDSVVMTDQQDNDNPDSPFPSPPSEPFDADDKLSQDDETIVHLQYFSFLVHATLAPFHFLTNSLLSGSFNPPFSPPELP